MNRTAAVCTAVALAALAGCGQRRYRTTSLGLVDYVDAFSAAREVVSQYFPIASADRAAGRIVTEPIPAQADSATLVSRVPSRKRGEVRLRRDDGKTYADVRVITEHLQSNKYRNMQELHDHRDVPDLSPARSGAALTEKQQQVWTPGRNDPLIEQRILDDLRQRLGQIPPR